MDRSLTNALSTALDIYNCIICLFMMISTGGEIKKSHTNRYFFLACLSVMIFNIADISNWQMEGTDPAWHIPALHILTFIFYAVVPFIFNFIYKYIYEYLKPHKIRSYYFSLSGIIGGCYMMGVVISPFTGFYYSITKDNYYQRGQFNFVSTIFFGIFFLITLIMILNNRKYFPRKSILAFLTFILFPITTQIIQMKFYGLNLVNLGMTCSMLLIFINAHHDLKVSLSKSERLHFKNEKKVTALQESIIMDLGTLLEFRDFESGLHTKRIKEYIQLLAEQTVKDGFYTEILTEDYINKMLKTCVIYDIGKITIPDSILKKDSRLNEFEYKIMTTHTEEGAKLIRKLFENQNVSDFMSFALDATLCHHERWNGSGYPHRLQGSAIPLCARMLAIADAFDALVYKRCYRETYSLEEAFAILSEEANTHFDPILIEEFLKIKMDIIGIVTKYDDGR